MASFLYRVGRLAGRRPFVVVLAWLAVLAGVAGSTASLQRPLVNEFELPDSEFGRVLDDLGQQIPEVAGGTGTVVLRSDDGFSARERAAVRDTMTQWQALPHVTGIVDPFTTQQRLDRSDERLESARRRLESGGAELDEGAYQLSRLRWLVAEGREDIARLRRARPEDPTLPARIRGQAELERRLAQGERRLAPARERLQRGMEQYGDAATLRRLGSGVRMVSKDGTTALVQIRFDKSMQELSPDDLALVPGTGQQLTDAGLEVDYGQELVFQTEVGGTAEVIGVGVAAVVLLVMLGSLVLAGLPLVIAVTGVGVSLLGAMALTHWLDLHQMAPVLGAMLGLAVGIDYALFIVNRHRRQLGDLARGGRTPTRESVRHSIALATGTAGTAVVVAGATVVIALAALLVSGIPVLVQMGVLAAATVSITVLVALTLTPALLSLAGARATPRPRRTVVAKGSGWPEAWVGVATRRAPAAIVGVVVALGVLAVPAASLRLGLPDGGSESPDSTAYQAYERVAEAFGPGANGPVLVSATWEESIPEADLVARQAQVAEEVAETPGVRDVLPIGVSKDRRTLAFQVVPAAGPSAERTMRMVQELRGEATAELAEQGADIGVTGQTVANIEVSQRLADALPLYLVLVIGLSLLLLTVVFRSVVIPVIATLGFLLSVVASFGVIVAVYQWGWLGSVFDVHRPGAVLAFMPTLLIGILFGLAMDYQMFLVSGMRESYVHGESAREAVHSGFVSGAKVVAAAALIMVSVFAGFVFSHMTMARPIGLGLAVGVLLDAFLVRMTLTPALMSLLGDKAWWMPAWLDRVLPHLDVEGSSLVEVDRPAPRPQRALEDARIS